MAAERHRPFVLALVVSLVLHALVLSLRPRETQHGSPSSPPIAARLTVAEPQEPSPAPVARPVLRQASKPRPAPMVPQLPAPIAAEPAPPMHAQPAADPAAIARYRYDVIATALRYQRDAPVPELATEGDVAISIGVRASGERAIMVKASSGQAALDAHALAMFRLALDEVAVPLGLRGQEFALDVRAVYSRDQ
jgi:hypothetical protein